MGDYRNIYCARCKRNTKHQRLKWEDEEFRLVQHVMCHEDEWMCLKCRTVLTIGTKE